MRNLQMTDGGLKVSGTFRVSLRVRRFVFEIKHSSGQLRSADVPPQKISKNEKEASHVKMLNSPINDATTCKGGFTVVA